MRLGVAHDGLFIGFIFLGRIVTYLWTNQKIFVVKSCGRGLRKLAMGCMWLWIHCSQSPCSFVGRSVVMYALV